MNEPEVVYEETDFLAVSKPEGMVVHPTRRGASLEGTLSGWLKERYPEIGSVGDDSETRPGIVHRLDRDTSGVLLTARNQKYFEYLKSLFQEGLVEKTYLALVFGVPQEREGIINAPIALKSGTTRRTVHGGKMEKQALTEYRAVQTSKKEDEGAYALLEVRPKTGRTHQIRVHLASIHHPVVGDVLYGRKKQPPWAGRLMLHALSVEFEMTEGKRVRIEAAPSADFLGILGRAGIHFS